MSMTDDYLNATSMVLNFDAVEAETEKAYLITFEPGVSKWIPKSQCEMIQLPYDDYDGWERRGQGEIDVVEWLVLKLELEQYEA